MKGSSWLAGGVRVLLWSVVATAHAADGNALPSEAWPAAGDFTTVAWLDGFPGRAAGALCQRCIRTGRYAFVLNTEAITVPHLGKIKAEPYGAAVRSPEVVITGLPAADLALLMEVDGRVFHCSGGRTWDGIAGPRLIESGRWVQRNDVDGLTFHSKDGLPLNVNARLEAVAWPDRLALILAAQPGYEPIPTGTACFGRVGGGFGLNGTNEFTVSPERMIDPAHFTFECWVYAPPGYDAATNAVPWLVCKGHHEQADGNYGITLQGGVPHGRLNIGGGRDQAFSVSAGRRLTLEAWNHVALTYDGRAFTIFLNGRRGGEVKIGRERVATTQPLIVGRRGDNSGDGYHFKGAVDEVAIYERPLSAAEIHDRFHAPEKPLAAGPATFIESFDPEGEPRSTRMRTRWRKGSMAIRLGSGGHVFQQRCDLPDDAAASDWHEVAVVFDPASLLPAADPVLPEPVIMVEATPVTVDPHQPPPTLPVRFDAVRGWHCIDLNRVEPTLPPEVNRGQTVVVGKEDVLRDPRNDVLDRARLVLTNSSNHEQAARLCFEKTTFAGSRVGSPITGLSAILRDAAGQPTGIPVQLSKNWHRGRGGSPYDGQWFRGFTQVRVPAKSTMRLELVMAYGHWGGVPAASHAQLSLLGWGQNQLWEESAIGSWGESICYEPDQVHVGASILDVRPLLVRSLPDGKPWQWTGNVGGGDFFRIEAPDGSRLWRRNMKAEYVRPGPCLTEVTYAGQLGSGIDHAETVSLSRTDDIVRGTYRLRMNVHEPLEFSRCVIFQIGADTYSHAAAKKIAVGTAAGLTQEWDAAWVGNASTTPPAVSAGTTPWVSLLGTASDGDGKPIGSRGFVIRKWRAVLGGREAEPWITEHGTPSTSRPSATVDIVPPPGVTRLEPGDFVEATIELLVLPLSAAEYYGPNEALRVALRDMANSWQLVHREAVGNDRHVAMMRGDLKHAYPDIRVTADDGTAEFTLHGGLGYVPLTFTGLASHRAGELRLDGKLVDQSVHGGDFWQTDYDPVTQTWSHTFTVARPGTTPANGQPVNVFYQQKS
ncbi:MAG: LamG domain-containing protein [Planctomycetota bacterium]|nr:LamG domain-containing protein [Planctomycetota bacterium]